MATQLRHAADGSIEISLESGKDHLQNPVGESFSWEGHSLIRWKVAFSLKRCLGSLETIQQVDFWEHHASVPYAKKRHLLISMGLPSLHVLPIRHQIDSKQSQKQQINKLLRIDRTFNKIFLFLSSF